MLGVADILGGILPVGVVLILGVTDILGGILPVGVTLIDGVTLTSIKALPPPAPVLVLELLLCNIDSAKYSS
jgi:hypothetical protein